MALVELGTVLLADEFSEDDVEVPGPTGVFVFVMTTVTGAAGLLDGVAVVLEVGVVLVLVLGLDVEVVLVLLEGLEDEDVLVVEVEVEEDVLDTLEALVASVPEACAN